MATALQAGSFYGKTRVCHRGPDLVVSEVCHGEERTLPAHAHEAGFFSLLLSGAYEERWAGAKVARPRGSLAFLPPQVAHADRIGNAGCRFFTVEVGSVWLERVRDVAAGAWRPAVLPPEAVWVARLLLRESRDQQPGAALAVEALVLELLVLAARTRAAAERHTPAWLATVREAIRADPVREWRTEDLAREAGVHPAHLARTVRRFEGRTLGELLREARVRVASGLIVRGEASLADVAHRCGFADQSHFTRVFRRVTGTTPAAFRRDKGRR